MTEKDIIFLQKIAEQLLVFCAQSSIDNQERDRVIKETRAKFKLVSENTMRSAVAVKKVVSKPNIKVQSRKVWTEKEIEDLPYLKNLKYRLTSDGIHQFRYRRNGYDLSFNSKNFEVAKKKAHDFIKSIKRLIRSEADIIKGKTLDFVAQAWFDLKAPHVNVETMKGYRSVYKNHILDRFGSKSIKSLLPMHLQPFFNELYAEKGKTCENAKIILNGIFEYAVANRICMSNPMKAVIVEKHVRVTGQALTDEQVKRFVARMGERGPFETAGLIILYSGIRGCELESMTFDWEQGTFTVLNGKLKKGQKVNPKNLRRTVPIFPGLWKIKERIERDDWKMPSKTLSANFRDYWPENTVKDLRHTFASRARESGVDNELVNLWTGHLPGNNVTANIYTHFSLEFQKREAEKINNY
jgi:integrase